MALLEASGKELGVAPWHGFNPERKLEEKLHEPEFLPRAWPEKTAQPRPGLHEASREQQHDQDEEHAED